MSRLPTAATLVVLIAGTTVALVAASDGGDPERSPQAAEGTLASPASPRESHRARSASYRAAPLRPCSSHIEADTGPDPGPGDADFVIGPAYLPNFLGNAHGTVTPSGGHRYTGVKTLIALRAGTRATLVVPPGHRSRIGLEYAHSVPHANPPPGLDGPFTVRNGGAAVRFEACPANEPAFSYPGPVGEWTPFSGGFFVAGPGCYPIELHVAGRSEPYRRNLSFGGVGCA